ncbi:MAG: sugar ABC transporter ATP-binding protein [Cardiobacteriaceae bacterium]|nr:sugar ABC transporter ATP-binding protein [Cardiobacteriaceae bacterium]
MSEYILELENISKSFPGVKALNGVSLKIKKGEVHALMGENGAGKSTLMKVLYGIYSFDSGGKMRFDGQPFNPSRPIEAIRSGLIMVPQEISPATNLTIAENFFLGREITFGSLGFLANKKMNEVCAQTLKDLGITMDVTKKMSDVSVAHAQLVAIATAVSNDAKVILMDEPSTSLTESEVEYLYNIVDKLKERGIAVIFISHKLDEVFRVSDRISILRDGQLVATHEANNISKEQLIEEMVGRSMSDMYAKEAVEIGEEKVLEVRNLNLKGCFKNINFHVRKGEILGIAGLVGAGRSFIAESLYGYRPCDSGDIIMHGKKIEVRNPNDAQKHKIGWVTEDRKLTGLFLNMDITDNVIMPDLSPYIRNFLISNGLAKETAEKQRTEMRIKAPSVSVLTGNLSGGNQQKVLIGRQLTLNPDVLILDEPTKGIDVGAKAEIYRLMVELAKIGKSIIMISSDMLELLAMSDRIMVMAEGQFTGELSREEATQAKVMHLASGLKLED